MPIYEYRCPEQHVTPKIRKYADRDDPVECRCGAPAERIWSNTHCPPDGVYSYAPNVGDPDRFERQRAAIRSGTKVIPRESRMPADHRDGQLSSRRS